MDVTQTNSTNHLVGVLQTLTVVDHRDNHDDPSLSPSGFVDYAIISNIVPLSKSRRARWWSAVRRLAYRFDRKI